MEKGFTCRFYSLDIDADRLHIAVCCLPVVYLVQSYLWCGIELRQGSTRGMLGGRGGKGELEGMLSFSLVQLTEMAWIMRVPSESELDIFPTVLPRAGSR